MPDAVMESWVRPAVILVATDLSDLERLMPFALEEAAHSGARIILQHVLAASGAAPCEAAEMPCYDPGKALEFATRALEPCCQTARKRRISCDMLLREGNVAQQIAVACRQFHADRVLIGTRNPNKMSKLVLGSVVEQVLRSVNLPVMTVGPEVHLPVASDERQRIVLHATTLRETSRPSAALACKIAAHQGARLLLLHVLPPPEEGTRKSLSAALDSTALEALRLLAAESEANYGLGVEPLVARGNPTIEILAEASENGANLIVLGASRNAPYERMTRDHVVYRILAHARCPVLTLRPPAIMPNESGVERVAVLS